MPSSITGMREEESLTAREIENCIIEAQLLLMKDKPLDEIPITAIVAKAGVGRGTFYRHFKSKEDVIRRFFEHNEEDFHERMEGLKPQSKEDCRQVLVTAFSMFREQKDKIVALIRSDFSWLYLAMLRDGLGAFAKRFCGDDEVSLRYLPSFLAGSLLGVTMTWLSNGCNTSDEEMADFFMRYTKLA